MIEGLERRIRDFKDGIGYNIFAVKVGVVARWNTDAFLEMRSFLGSEAKAAGRRPTLGERLGLLALRRPERELIESEVEGGLRFYKNRLRNRWASGHAIEDTINQLNKITQEIENKEEKINV